MLGILLKNETVCSLGGSNSKINSIDYKIHPLFDAVGFLRTPTGDGLLAGGTSPI